MDIILASGSPRRRELLEMLGLEFEVRPARGGEHPPEHAGPEEIVLALAGDEIIARDGLPVKTVDTTAAGDSFTGGFITRLLEEGTDIASLSRETLTRILDFANTVGALTTTRKGAICALPTRDEVEAQLASNQ